MTLRSILSASVLTGLLSVPAFAQVPYVKIYSELNSDFYHCGQAGTFQELIVVLHNVDDVVSAIDFSVQYPPSMVWLFDLLPDARYVNNEVITIGNSPTGVAVAWHSCCMQDASQGLVVLRPVVLWRGNCNCAPIIVGGYGPLGKTQPSYIRASDFSEHAAVGGTTNYNPDFCDIAVEPTTWGRVKSLYR